MSGVYIPGFKKPVACWHCALFNNDEERCPLHDDWYPSLKDEYVDCPLVEAPDHGRLIDADALLETDLNLYRSDGAVIGRRKYYTKEDIQDMPTIIPGDKESTK